MLDIVVLLSVGRHPASSRARLAELDARALELALRLVSPAGHEGQPARLCALHAGDPAEPALREYLGMGLAQLTVLEVASDGDPLPGLHTHLAALQPALILAGAAAEQGASSGFLPYAIAAALGCSLIPGVATLTWEADGVEAEQALPRGQRRRVYSTLPLLCTIDRAGPEPRAFAFAKARRGIIQPMTVLTKFSMPNQNWQQCPARRRPKRLVQVATGTVAERMRAATEQRVGQGRVLVDTSAEQAAKEIYDYLTAEGIVGGN